MKHEEQIMTATLLFALAVIILAVSLFLWYYLYLPAVAPQARPDGSEVFYSPPYGCPGCPDNFTSWAQDMCRRFPGYTISDGVNEIKCTGAGQSVHSGN